MQSQEKKSIRPPRLKPGDTIGIVSPAGPFDPEKFMKGKTVLESIGFQTFFGLCPGRIWEHAHSFVSRF
jgi:muramoyltetrapeptide carboxypeptidase LdcA involved in peptidoglycan recycling